MKEEEFNKLKKEKLKLVFYLEIFIHQIKVKSIDDGWKQNSNLDKEHRESELALDTSSSTEASEILVLFFFSDYPPLQFAPSSACQSSFSNGRYRVNSSSKENGNDSNSIGESIQGKIKTATPKYSPHLLTIFEFNEGKRCQLELDQFLKDNRLSDTKTTIIRDYGKDNTNKGNISAANFKIVNRISMNDGYEMAQSEDFSNEVQYLYHNMKDAIDEICFLHLDYSNCSSGLSNINDATEDRFDYQCFFRKDNPLVNIADGDGSHKEEESRKMKKSEEKRLNLLLFNRSNEPTMEENKLQREADILEEEKNHNLLGSMEVTIRFTCEFSIAENITRKDGEIINESQQKTFTPQRTGKILADPEILYEEEMEIDIVDKKYDKTLVKKKDKGRHTTKKKVKDAPRKGDDIITGKSKEESFQIDPITMGITYNNNNPSSYFPLQRRRKEYTNIDQERLHDSSQNQKKIITLKEIEGLTLNTVKEISQPKPFFFVGEDS